MKCTRAMSLTFACAFAAAISLAAPPPASAQVFVSATFGASPVCGWSACPIAVGAAFDEPAYYASMPYYAPLAYYPPPVYAAPAYYNTAPAYYATAPAYYATAPAYYPPPFYGPAFSVATPGVGVAFGLGAIGLTAFAASQPAYGFAPYGYGYGYPASVSTVNSFYRVRNVRTIVRRPVVVRHGPVVLHRGAIAVHHPVVVRNRGFVAAHPARAPFSVAHVERGPRVGHAFNAPAHFAPAHFAPAHFAPARVAPMRAAPMRVAPAGRPMGGGRPGGRPPRA